MRQTNSRACPQYVSKNAWLRELVREALGKPPKSFRNGNAPPEAERMNRTVKDATIRAFHYPDLGALKAHVLAFITAYNFAKHLKALRWRTPFQAICNAWNTDPTVFKINPLHLIPGPNTSDVRPFKR